MKPPRIHRIEVSKTARYATLGGPDGAEELWVVLHGYRQLADRFLRRFHPLDDGTRWIVAPEALNHFYIRDEDGRHGPDAKVGGTWMTRFDREAEIADYVRYLDRLVARLGEELPDPGVPLTVLGFSQGVHTAARWVVLGAVRPVRLVTWGAELPGDLPEAEAAERLGELDLVLVTGDADPAERDDLRTTEAERLERWGVVARRERHPGGHRIDPDLLGALAAEWAG